MNAWRAAACLAALAVAGFAHAANRALTELPPAPADAVHFAPPAPDAIPDTPLGAMIRFDRDVFTDTQRYARATSAMV